MRSTSPVCKMCMTFVKHRSQRGNVSSVRSCMKRTTRLYMSQTTDTLDLFSIEAERASWIHNAPGIEMNFQGF